MPRGLGFSKPAVYGHTDKLYISIKAVKIGTFI